MNFARCLVSACLTGATLCALVITSASQDEVAKPEQVPPVERLTELPEIEPNESATKPTKIPGRVIYRPSPLPDRIILTLCGDPARMLAVTWRTDASVRTPQAQIAPARESSSFQRTAKTIAAQSQSLAGDGPEALYHTVRFEDLRPRTTYCYRVGDGVNWSEWFQFSTAADGPEPFTFVYLGDAQNDIKDHWSRVIRQSVFDAPKLRFFLHAGDLINTGNADTEWGEWHQAGGWLNATIPTIATPGNHEYYRTRTLPTLKGIFSAGTSKPQSGVTEHWRPQFEFPLNGLAGLEETVYFVDYQGVRFISLNSNERITDQVPWLENVLANNPQRWTIITFHHPLFSPNGTKARDNVAIRNAWMPIFDKYKVDLVLQGHDHTYARSGLVSQANVTFPHPDESNIPLGALVRNGNFGTVYAVSVSGPKMYTLREQPWMRSSAQGTQLYQVIRIDGDRLRYEARTAVGTLYDLFELRKKNDRNILLERDDLAAETTKHTSGRWEWLSAVAAILAILGISLAALSWRRGPQNGNGK